MTNISERERQTIVNALYAAAEQYEKVAVTSGTELPSLGEQFKRQAKEAISIAERLS